MALMDSLLNAAAQALGNKDSGSTQNSLIDMAMDLVQRQGGVSSLINQLQQGGLGDVLNSWVSNQQDNAPISGSDLQNALGSDTIGQVAQKFGIDANQAGDLLAQVLPNLVDKATPNGSAQEADGFGLDDIASSILKNFTK
ncbi:YidB family protein [Neisseria sicca]|uniref:YidB family protein n=1 Tax=Neisseria sicca TaxID=490 RepID=UPI003F9FDFFD